MSNHLDTFDVKDCEFKVLSGNDMAGGQHAGLMPGTVWGLHKPSCLRAVGKGKRSTHLNKEDCIWKLMLRLEELDNKSTTND
jgi:protein subunit release factor A